MLESAIGNIAAVPLFEQLWKTGGYISRQAWESLKERLLTV